MLQIVRSGTSFAAISAIVGPKKIPARKSLAGTNDSRYSQREPERRFRVVVSDPFVHRRSDEHERPAVADDWWSISRCVRCGLRLALPQ